MSELFFLQQSWHPAFFGLIDLEIFQTVAALGGEINNAGVGNRLV
jgi:hypothetical protein